MPARLQLAPTTIARAAILATLCVAGLGSGCGRQNTVAKPAEALLSRPVLLEVESGATERLSVRLGVCQGEDCPLVVALFQEGKAAATINLAWNATSSEPVKAQPDWMAGASGPLDGKPEGVEAWTTGSEEQTVVTSVRAIRLPSGAAAILASQMAGFEHPKRRHEIYAARGGQLTRVWEYAEPQGPYWTAVAVRKATSQDELVLLRTFSPGGELASTWEAVRLEWNADQNAFFEAGAAKVRAVVAGEFAGLERARNVLAGAGECLAGFDVVESKQLGLRGGGKYALAALTVSDPVRSEVLERLKTCSPAGAARVVPLP